MRVVSVHLDTELIGIRLESLVANRTVFGKGLGTVGETHLLGY
jgi:hypothetical protein